MFFFKHKTAYEMRISDWSSDVCSSDLECPLAELPAGALSVAFGAGVRRHDFFATLPFNDIDRRRDNLFAYGELLVPLASPAQAIGGLHRLSLTGALRFEAYSDSASIVTPKLGIIWEPVAAIRRAS